MNAHKKALLILAILVAFALIFSVYTACAHLVASRVLEIDGILNWPTPGYDFFPWPKTETGLQSQIIIPLNQADQQYYHYIIQTGILIVPTLFSWLVVAWKIWQIKKT